MLKPRGGTRTGRGDHTVTRAACQLFFDQGFSATSMDAVAKAAGVSKATLYAYFPSKEALFASLIVAECEDMQRPADARSVSRAAAGAAAVRPAISQRLPQTEDVAFVRIIANESGRFPELGRCSARAPTGDDPAAGSVPRTGQVRELLRISRQTVPQPGPRRTTAAHCAGPQSSYG
jgi:AcrR family transcriptional regulator